MRKIFILILTVSNFIFAEENNIERYSTKLNLYNYETAVEAEKSVLLKDIKSPAIPVLASLAIPGLGQYINNSPIWKTALFAGIEMIGITSYISWTNRADDITNEYEDWADEHWDMHRWVSDSPGLLNIIQSNGYPDVNDVIIDGSHHITIIVNGVYESSDILVENTNIDYIEVRDWDFYEGVGKYDQFVAGWDDALSDWFIKNKKITDGDDELIVMTPNKQHYLDLRNDSNILYRNAKFALSAVVFNHIFSALDALFTANKNIELSYELDVTKQLDNIYSIKGISLTWNF